MKQYLVKASNLNATYSVGRFCASSPGEAKEMAREHYRCSQLGRELKDAGAFRFWISTGEED